MTAAKAVVAAIGTIVTVLTAALADNVLDASEIGQIAAAAITGALTVAGVWAIPNRPRTEQDGAVESFVSEDL